MLDSIFRITLNYFEITFLDPDQTAPSTLFVEGFLNISADDKADDFCCDWHF